MALVIMPGHAGAGVTKAAAKEAPHGERGVPCAEGQLPSVSR